MSASLQPMTVEEFLTWERAQPYRYEFDGLQPMAMTGGSVQHARVQTRLVLALGPLVTPPCEVFGSELKVRAGERIRYPDASVVCGADDQDTDLVTPIVVFEVLSPSTASTDLREKPVDYASVASIMVYIILEADRPGATVHRRSAGWEPELVTGLDAVVALTEIGITLPLRAIYRNLG